MSCATTDDANTLSPFIRGDTWIIAVELTDEGVAENLTGATIWATLKTSLADVDPGALQYEHVVPAGVDATAGKARIEVPSSLTDTVPPGRYWMDLQRVFPGAPPAVWTFFRASNVEVLADITRAVT